MIKTILLAASMVMSAGIYYPMLHRVLKRKATRDFSKTAQWFILAAQINGFALAAVESAPYLQAYYVVQIILTATMLHLIYHYWDALPPLMRGGNK
jgi:hypothetical protein